MSANLSGIQKQGAGEPVSPMSPKSPKKAAQEQAALTEAQEAFKLISQGAGKSRSFSHVCLRWN